MLSLVALITHSANRFMLRDPRTYSNPSMFKPERFLPHNEIQPEMDPRTICFGFGRRYCFPQHFHHSGPLCRSQDLPRSTYLTLHNHENADITWLDRTIDRLTPRRCVTLVNSSHDIGRVWRIHLHWEWHWNHSRGWPLPWNAQVWLAYCAFSWFASAIDVSDSHPKPFKCNIKPRSVKALELIQQEIQE